MITFYIILCIYFFIVFIYGFYKVGLEIGIEKGIQKANSTLSHMRINDELFLGTKSTIDQMQKFIDELPRAPIDDTNKFRFFDRSYAFKNNSLFNNIVSTSV